MLDVVNLATRLKHIKMIWHVPIVNGNTLQVIVEKSLSLTEVRKIVET